MGYKDRPQAPRELAPSLPKLPRLGRWREPTQRGMQYGLGIPVLTRQPAVVVYVASGTRSESIFSRGGICSQLAAPAAAPPWARGLRDQRCPRGFSRTVSLRATGFPGPLGDASGSPAVAQGTTPHWTR